MSRRILLDAGPLVALLRPRDEYHEWASTQWKNLRTPLFTCESAITEACFLLRGVVPGSQSVLELLSRSIIRVDFALERELSAVSRLMDRYADVPMALADACLVRMSELDSESTVFTLDSDFRRYRRNKRQVIPLIIPDDRT